MDVCKSHICLKERMGFQLIGLNDKRTYLGNELGGGVT